MTGLILALTLNSHPTNPNLVVGDVTINPNATVLVMTTEILRSMLYRGAELNFEVKL